MQNTSLASLLLALLTCFFYPKIAQAQTPIACDGDVNGSISTLGEVDTYTFTASAGDIVIVRMQYDGTLIDPKLQLNGPGINETHVGPSLDPARIGAVQLAGGAYTIRASDDGNNNTGNYGLSLQIIKPSCATPIGCTDDVNGTISKKAEMDAYTFEVTAACEFVIARMQYDGAVIDPHLELYRVGSPQVVQQSNSTSLDPARINAPNLQPGTYVLVAMDEKGWYTGNYGLSVQFVKPACALPIGCTDDVNGTISKKAEIDAYTFEVTVAGEFVIARMQYDGNVLDPYLELYKLCDNQPLHVSNSTSLDPARINAPKLQPGTYILLAMDEKAHYASDYGLSVQFVKPACALPIGCTDDVNGAISKKAEMDAYTFEVTAACEFVLARMQYDGNVLDPYLELYKLGDGQPLYVSTSSSLDPARINAPKLQPGTYILLAMDEKAQYVSNYGLSVQFVSPACAVPIACDGEVTGTISKKAEVDAYTFEVTTAGEYAIARMQYDGNVLDPYLELYKLCDNQPLHVSTSTSLAPARLNAPNLQPGTYILLAMDEKAQYVSNYGLSLQLVRAACAVSIGCSDDITGTLAKKAEMDAYTFEVTTSCEWFIARMQQDGSNINARLELYRVGATDALDEDNGSSSDPARVEGRNLQPGTYVLVAMDVDGTYTGGYGLSVQSVKAACAAPIACGDDLTATLAKKGAIDAYTFEVAAAGAYFIARMQQDGSSIDGRLELYRICSSADPLTDSGNFSDPARLDAKPLQPGIYVLLAMDHNGTHTGNYGLSLQHLNPACATDLACDGDLSSAISKKAEMDAYRFAVNATDPLILQFHGKGVSGNYRLEFYDGLGNEIQPIPHVNADVNENVRLELSPANFNGISEVVCLVMEKIGAWTGAYDLSIQRLRPACAQPLACSDDIRASTALSTEMDAYALPVAPGDRLVLHLLEKEFSGELRLQFFHADGKAWFPELVADGTLQRMEAYFSQNDTLLIVASDVDTDEAIADYALSVQMLRPDCAAALSCSATDLTGNLDKPARADAFHFQVTAGQRYMVRAKTTSGTGLLEIYSPSGTLFSTLAAAPGLNQKLDSSGTWLVLLRETNGSVGGTYSLAFLAVGDTACATKLACGQTLAGNLAQKTSLRQYRVAGQSGKKWVSRMRGTAGITARMEMFRANGQSLVPSSGATARLDYAFDQTAEHFLVVSENTSAASGNYHLAAQVANDFGCGQSAIGYNESPSGSIAQPVEMDGFTLSGAAGDVAVFQWGSCSATFDAQVELYNAAGQLLRSKSTDNGLARADTFRLPASGQYKFLVMEKEGDEQSDYGASLQKVNPGTSALALTPGSPVVGVFVKTAEMQVFRFEAQQGTAATLTLNALSGNLQPRLELYDPAGKRIAGPSGSGTSAVLNQILLPATGTYTLLAFAGNLCGAGGFDLTWKATLSATPTALNFGGNGGEKTFAVAGNCTDWTISDNANWLSLDPMSGTGPATVTATCQPNLSALSRTATVTLTGCGISTTVTVTQAAATLNATPATLNVGAAKGEATFAVGGTCTEWLVLENATWLMVSPASGNAPANVTVKFDPNPSTLSRTATLTLVGCGTTVTVTVTQLGANPVLSPNPAFLTVSVLGGSTTFEVEGNCDSWTLTETAPWLALSPASGTGPATVTVTYQPNLTAVPRTATLTLMGCGITVFITVTQPGATLITDVAALNLPSAAAGQTAFSVQGTCSDWTVSDNASWISLNPASGNAPATVTVNYESNQTAVQRTATLTLVGCGITVLITVTQPGATLTASTTFLNVPENQGEATFAVGGTCTNWTVLENATWLTVSPASGNGPVSVTVTYEANPSTQPRTATLTLVGCGTVISIVVEQKGAVSSMGSPASLGRLRVFPSPAVQGVFVEMPEAAGSELRLVVSSAQGQVVSTLAAQAAGQVWVERGDWPAGLYFLRLEDAVGQVRAAGKVVFAR